MADHPAPRLPRRPLADRMLPLVLVALGLGLVVRPLAHLAPATPWLLGLMVAAVSFTIPLGSVTLHWGRLVPFLIASNLAMPLVAWLIGRLLGLATDLLIGLVLVAAVLPELSAPVLVRSARGNTAFSALALVTSGLLGLATVPLVVAFVADGAADVVLPLARALALFVVVPMAVGLITRAVRTEGPATDRLDLVAGEAATAFLLMLLTVVVAAGRDGLLVPPRLLLPVFFAVVALNLIGYLIGDRLPGRDDMAHRKATRLSVGMRDFAVAAVLVVAIGLPARAALPALLYGVVEMATAAWSARAR